MYIKTKSFACPLTFASLLSLAGCAVSPSNMEEVTESNQGIAPAPSNSQAAIGPAPASPSATTQRAADANDIARSRAFVDERYRQSDVKHSFKTIFGETVDCIDFFASPGARALSARGTPIRGLPRPPAPPVGASAGARSATDVTFNGQPDDEGHPRACPTSTAPMLRVTVADIQSVGGMDAYLKRHTKPHGSRGPTLSPPGAPAATPADLSHYAHATETVARAPTGSLWTSGEATFSIFSPPVPDNYDHDLSQIWLYSGTGFNTSYISSSSCTTDCIQSVEVGWRVEPKEFQGAHLFTYATANGYFSGSYDGLPGGLKWMPYPEAKMVPGQQLLAGTIGGATHELHVVAQFSAGAGWWIWADVDGANGSWLGYYPSSEYTGPMASNAQTFQAGGEVYNTESTWVVPMGSGSASNAGYGQAAYARNVKVAAGGQSTYYPPSSALSLAVEAPTAYGGTLVAAGGPPSSNWLYWGAAAPSAPPTPCSDLCADPTKVAVNGSLSENNLGTGSVCIETLSRVQGGNCGNMVSPRVLTVNGTSMPCNNSNWTTVPPARNGGYCVQTSAGDRPSAFVTLW